MQHLYVNWVRPFLETLYTKKQSFLLPSSSIYDIDHERSFTYLAFSQTQQCFVWRNTISCLFPFIGRWCKRYFIPDVLSYLVKQDLVSGASSCTLLSSYALPIFFTASCVCMGTERVRWSDGTYQDINYNVQHAQQCSVLKRRLFGFLGHSRASSLLSLLTVHTFVLSV